jgi:glyoxalase family protein
MQLNGIHHISAVTAKIANNVDFYTEILGMRLVKKSVNQDDVSAYHLFYADKLGSPGTDLTFFDWPQIGDELRGTDSIAGITFRVPGIKALDFWVDRFRKLGIHHQDITSFEGRSILPFEDPEGQRLYLVDDQFADFEGEIWNQADIPEEFALRGFYSVILSIPSFADLGTIFRKVLHFQESSRITWLDGETPAIIFSTKEGKSPGAEIWLLEEPSLNRAQLGAGGVHHVAFRVKDEEEERRWRSHLIDAGLRVTNVIDRFWFRSIYFRVSKGILFEIATDGPGFTIDENLDVLGERLMLPPFLEAKREEIESGLLPIGIDIPA